MSSCYLQRVSASFTQCDLQQSTAELARTEGRVWQGKPDVHSRPRKFPRLVETSKPEMSCRNVVETRLVVHIYRELRRKQLKLEKGKGSKVASVSVAQLKKSFPSLSNYDITSRLRDRCECQPLPVRPPCPSIAQYSKPAAGHHYFTSESCFLNSSTLE